jgi:hypothetical protein
VFSLLSHTEERSQSYIGKPVLYREKCKHLLVFHDVNMFTIAKLKLPRESAQSILEYSTHDSLKPYEVAPAYH